MTATALRHCPATASPPCSAPPVADPARPPASAPADPRAAAITPEVIDLVRRGRKIHAIKLYRELTNLDLKTAKRVIDHL